MIYLEDTASMVCNVEGCQCGGELYLHSACHTGKTTSAVLENQTLKISCSICEDEVATLAVQSEEQDSWEQVYVKLSNGILHIIYENKVLTSFPMRSK